MPSLRGSLIITGLVACSTLAWGGGRTKPAAPARPAQTQWGPRLAVFTNTCGAPCTFKITDCTRDYQIGVTHEGKEMIYEEQAKTDFEAHVDPKGGKLWFQFRDPAVDTSLGAEGTAMLCYEIADADGRTITSSNVLLYLGERLRAHLADRKIAPAGGFLDVVSGPPTSLLGEYALTVADADPGHLVLEETGISGSGTVAPLRK